MKRYALMAVIALVGAACSSGSGDASLTVYSGRSEDLVQPLIDRFMEETGIEVTVRYDDSANLAATILEEGSGSPADVFFSQDPASLGSVALDSLFITLPDDVRALVPERFSDAGGAWIGVSGRSRVVIYDTELLDPGELPATEDGFTDPAWAGRVAIAPTNGSFLAFVAAKILLDGEDATRAWLEGMAANGSPTFPNNSSIVMAANDGQIEAGLVNHYYQLRTLAEDPSAPGANHFFGVATAGSIVMPAGVGILASSDEQDAALRFVEFLLSEDSQVYFADETLEYPVIDGVPAADVLPPLDSLVTPALDLSQLATTLDKATDLVAEAGLL
jgi:iron(III) transport system substrate-binding protein